MTDDARLAAMMAAAQAGDGDTYAQLLQQITVLLRRVIRRRRGFLGADAVEDLVQDVLLSVHSVRATYDPGRPFLPWLLAITRHRLVDRARQHARTSAHEIVVDDLDVTFATDATNLTDERLEDRDVLRTAIASLPAGQRDAIDLLKLKELSLKEAAAVTGTSVGALKVATHRAMKTLRQRLHAHDSPRHR